MPKIELLHANCMDYMGGLEDNAFELAIVDPPYGLPKRYAQGSGKLKDRAIQGMYKKGWDIAPKPEYFQELMRVSKNQIIWGGNYFRLPPSRGFIIWDKFQHWPNFSDCEYAWNSIDGVAKIFKYAWGGLSDGTVGRNKKLKNIHPTQKPVELYQWLLKNYAKEGDRILDTHLGSGSSAIASHYAGHDFVGMELDEDYYKAACKRFDSETAQETLF